MTRALAVGFNAAAPEISDLQLAMQSVLGTVVMVADFGIDTASIQLAINSCTAGQTLRFATGASYQITQALTVGKGITIDLNGATITQLTSNTGGFTVTGSGVTFIGPGSIVGPQYAADQANEVGIYLNGTSAASPISGFRASNLTVSSWGRYGIYGVYVDDLAIERNSISNIFYGGIVLLSAIRGVIHGNDLQGIGVAGGISGNAYGIALSRNTFVGATLITDPPSSDITVSSNTVTNNPTWSAYDTHDGQRIAFTGNAAYLCKKGIEVVASNQNLVAPKSCTVTGNVLDSGKTDGTAGHGIAITGVLGTDLADCSVTGNTIRGYGDDTNAVSAAIFVTAAMGLIIAGNTIVEASPTAIIFEGDQSYGAIISGNTITDTWTNTQADARGIYFQVANCSASISTNSFNTNTKTATHVADNAIYCGNIVNTIFLGRNNANAWTKYLNVGAAVVVRGMVGIVTATGSIGGALVAAGAVATGTATIIGARTGNAVAVSPATYPGNGIGWVGYVSANDTVTVVIYNYTAAGITPTASAYNCAVTG